MEINFEIKYREGLARTGVFKTKNGKVNTPTLMPVLDPLRPRQIPIEEFQELGAEIFITNAYLCYRNEEASKKALATGIHGLINYDGPIMTDSGAFQLMEYGSVDVTNEVITKFQEDIKVNLGVFLDIPIATGTYDKTKEALDITLDRAKEHINLRTKDDVMWAGPIQGGKYLDLISKSAEEMGKMPFHIYAIGSVVPLLENYDYITVSKMIFTAKRKLPFDRPVHLFGAGHPMIFALAVYLGIDLFDSAAYWLFAKAGRYMTSSGSHNLEDLEFFPCGCIYCSNTNPTEVKKLKNDEKLLFLAKHNIAVSFNELRIIKQSIKDGRLWNLVLQRSSSHPSLSLAVQYLNEPEVISFLELFYSINYKKARLFSHVWSIFDPLIKRYRERVIERFPLLNKDCVLYTNHLPEKFVDSKIQKVLIHPIFGLIPFEWFSIYPIMQHVSFIEIITSEIISFVNEWVIKYKDKLNVIYNTTDYEIVSTKQVTYDELQIISEKSDENIDQDRNQILALIRYQYNVEIDILEHLGKINVKRSKKSNRIKEFSVEKERWGTIRASDSLIIPGELMIMFLHNSLSFPNYRVVIEEDVKEYIKSGKSCYSKFCTHVDKILRPGDECIIVTPDDELLGWGQLQLNSYENKSFNNGTIVKTRQGIK